MWTRENRGLYERKGARYPSDLRDEDIMTPRDRAGDRPGRREAAGDAGHRQGFPTPAGGSHARPERRFPKAWPNACGRGAWHPMFHIAAPRAPSRKPWETVSMGHYQGPLV